MDQKSFGLRPVVAGSRCVCVGGGGGGGGSHSIYQSSLIPRLPDLSTVSEKSQEVPGDEANTRAPMKLQS